MYNHKINMKFENTVWRGNKMGAGFIRIPERFSKVGAVKFILGKQDYCSSWVKAWLKNEGILNKEYQLAARGLKIKNCLLHMIDEVR